MKPAVFSLLNYVSVVLLFFVFCLYRYLCVCVCVCVRVCVCVDTCYLKRNSFWLFKAIENFSWNTRVLKGQADLIRQAKIEAQEYMNQIRETAVSLGFHVNDPNDQSAVENTDTLIGDR